MPDGRPFAFAGLWESWDKNDNKDTDYKSCTIITTESNELIRPFHQRMPVIIPPESYDIWLDPGRQDTGPLRELIRPYPADSMTLYRVSPHVNSPKHNSPNA